MFAFFSFAFFRFIPERVLNRLICVAEKFFLKLALGPAIRNEIEFEFEFDPNFSWIFLFSPGKAPLLHMELVGAG